MSGLYTANTPDNPHAWAVEMAAQEISANGMAVKWVRVERVPNPDKPWQANADREHVHDVHILFMDSHRYMWEAERSPLRSDTPGGRVLGYMGPVCFTPSVRDRVIRNGVTLTVINADPLAPNGIPILWTVNFALGDPE